MEKACIFWCNVGHAELYDDKWLGPGLGEAFNVQLNQHVSTYIQTCCQYHHRYLMSTNSPWEVPHTSRIVPQMCFPHNRAEKLRSCSSLRFTGIHNLRNCSSLVFPKTSCTLSGPICLHTTEWLIPLTVKHSQRKSCQQLLCIQQFRS